MSGPAVVSLGELVPLMYRARWLRFFVSGQVTSREESPDGAGWESGSLHAAPGGRYRADNVQLLAKMRYDPKGLLNPGKMVTFHSESARAGATTK